MAKSKKKQLQEEFSNLQTNTTTPAQYSGDTVSKNDKKKQQAKSTKKPDKSNLASDIVSTLGKDAVEYGKGVGGVFQGIARAPEQITRSLFNQTAANVSNTATGNKTPTDKYGNVDITPKKPQVFGIPHSELAAKILYGDGLIKTYQQTSSDVEKSASQSKNKTIKNVAKYAPFLQPVLAAGDATTFTGTGIAAKEGSKGTFKSLLSGESRVKLNPKNTKNDKPPIPEISQEKVDSFRPKQVGVNSVPTEPTNVKVRTPGKPASEIPEYQAPEPKTPIDFKSLHGKEAILKNDAGKAIKVKISADGKSFKLAENLLHDGKIVAKKGASEIGGVPNSFGSFGEQLLKKGKIEPVHVPPPEAIDKNIAFGETDHKLSVPKETPAEIKPPVSENPKPGDRKLSPNAIEYAHSVNHPDDIIKETADSWYKYDKEAKGGQLLNTASPDDPYHATGGIKRISEHSPFYSSFYKENGRRPSRAEYQAEVKKQIKAGGGNLVEKDIADAHGLATTNHADAGASTKDIATPVNETAGDTPESYVNSEPKELDIQPLLDERIKLQKLKSQYPIQASRIDGTMKQLEAKIAEVQKTRERGQLDTQKSAVELNKVNQQIELLKAKQVDSGRISNVDDVKLKHLEERRLSLGGAIEPLPAEIAGTTETASSLKPLAVTSTSEKGTSKLAVSVQSKALKEKLISKTEAEIENLPQYNKANMKEQADFATKLINDDPKKAIDIALGRTDPPTHILTQMVYNAVEEYATKLGGKEGGQLLRGLASSKHVSNLTVMAQNVRAAGERDPHSAVNMINDVATTRAKVAESRLKKSIAKTEQEDRATIRAATPKAGKYDWENFINSIEC